MWISPKLEFSDRSLDAVVCNHVLEHVPDDRKAMREIGRVLKDDGWAMLLVPLSDKPKTDEDATITTNAERLRRFGQRDHVRRYGRDYFDRLRAEGLRISVTDMGQVISPECVERYRLRSVDGNIDVIPIASRASG
jgi:ubiquinone/menaquinone biosynthesis C-methylase UbiE